MTPDANMKCPEDCGGHLEDTDKPDVYVCTRCETEVRQVIAEEADLLREVADSDSPAATLAQAALEVEGYR